MKISATPKTFKEKLKWLGPGIIWLAAGAGGAGELLFPPRVGSLYEYSFLWILILSIFFKWVIVREIGRWTVCTGENFVSGLKRLNNRFDWPVWLILIPQLFIAATSIAGLGGSAATALVLFWDIDIKIWFLFSVITGTAFLVIGKYKAIENISTIITTLLALIAIVTAISVFPSGEKFLKGFVPSVPSNTDYHEVLPWISYVLAGSAGMIWYSYWLPAKGYGVSNVEQVQNNDTSISDADQSQLKGWIKQMTLDISIGIVVGTFIVIAFLILGAELLAPKKLLPEENKVAETLANMLRSVWGNAGYWFMAVGVFAGFWGTLMTNQDGWARMLASGSKSLFPTSKASWLKDERRLKKIFILTVLAAVPIVIYFYAGEPVGLLQLGGILQIMFIPFVAWLVLHINRKFLPPALQPQRPIVILTHTGAICFTFLSLAYLLQIIGVLA